MTASVAIFTYPSLTALIKNASLIKKAERLILFCHADQRHLTIFNTLFCKSASLLCSQNVEIRTIHQMGQAPFSAEAIELVRKKSDLATSLQNWAIHVIKMEPGLAIRYVHRVFLERAFVAVATHRALTKEFADCEMRAVHTGALFPDFDDATITRLNAASFIMMVLAWILSPIIFFARLWRELTSVSFSIRKPTLERYELVVYEIGFLHPNQDTNKNENAIKSMHRKSNVSLLFQYDKAICAQFMSDIWRPSIRQIDDYKKHLGIDNYHYLDWADFKITPCRLLASIKLYGNAIFNTVRHLRATESVFDAARLAGLFTREQIISDNMNTAAVLGFDDYSERSIVRTHVGRLRAIKVFLIQHSANDGIRSEAELTTATADHYLTMSQFARDAFADYWPASMIVPYGYPRLDGMLELLAQRKNLRSVFADLPNPEKPIVVFALPRFTSREHFLNTFEAASDFLDFLSIAAERYKDTLNILLRPKQLVGWESTIEPTGFPTRNLILDRDLVTAEFLAAADLVISNVGSGILSECALLKISCSQFDYRYSHTDMFDRFGKNFFLHSTDQMISLLDALVDVRPTEIDNDLIFKEFSDPYIANRNTIIRDLIHAHQNSVISNRSY